ncbi:MAG: winged helix-turn-helix domain-containing protein [Candidatus Margulisiibacteriota bacterium]
MLEVLLAGKIKEQILFYLFTRSEGHAREIARTFAGHPTAFIRQLKKLEKGEVLISRLKGRTRLYSFNPRYPFQAELEALLAKALSFIPTKEREKYYTPRLRPRRAGKPL